MVTATISAQRGGKWEELGQVKVIDGKVQSNSPAVRLLIGRLLAGRFRATDGEPFILALPDALGGSYRVELEGRPRKGALNARPGIRMRRRRPTAAPQSPSQPTPPWPGPGAPPPDPARVPQPRAAR